jgi:hypothetical protein
MKKFTIVREETLIECVTYTVEAETESEALELVEDGEIDDNEDHWTEDTAEVNYYVQSEEDLDEEEDSE